MKVSEYISKMPSEVTQITFIKARARQDAHTPFHHAEYQTTPLYWVNEITSKNRLANYIILNDRQESITWLSGSDWNIAIHRGEAKCLLVVSPEDFELLIPSKAQREHMVSHIDEKLMS